MIFVFGSNLAGRHGKGAALFAATHYGACRGIGEGHTGNAYAIPTKDRNLKVRSLAQIAISVQKFIKYAKTNSYLTFEVTKIGCGLAGYKEEEIAPLFKGVPRNCYMPSNWLAKYIDHD